MLERENDILNQRVDNGLEPIDRNDENLNGPLAYKMITAFELWRDRICLLMVGGPKILNNLIT